MTIQELKSFFDELDGAERGVFAAAYLDRLIFARECDGGLGMDLAPEAVEAYRTARRTIGRPCPDPVPARSKSNVTRFLDLCIRGGFYCHDCKTFVDVTEGADSIRRCDQCQGARLKWHPPVEGMNQ